MNLKNIRKLDLNLLVIMEALLRLQNTTRAGKELGLSQPAISHALQRLRYTFEDPLFVRAPRGLTPTKRALSLEKPIQDFLHSLEESLEENKKFDLSKVKTVFRLSSTEYFDLLVLPRLMAIAKKAAPLVQILTKPAPALLPREDLLENRLDLAIAGFYGQVPPGFFRQEIFRDNFVAVKSKEGKKISSKMTLKQYLEHQHLLISIHGDMRAMADEALEVMGSKREIQGGMASFATPPWMLAQNPNLLLTCPRKLTHEYLKFFPLKMYELPFKIDVIQIHQVWHGRQQEDPLHTWMRQQIFEICQSL